VVLTLFSQEEEGKEKEENAVIVGEQVKTITSSMNVTDYFKQRMAQFQSARASYSSMEGTQSTKEAEKELEDEERANSTPMSSAMFLSFMNGGAMATDTAAEEQEEKDGEHNVEEKEKKKKKQRREKEKRKEKKKEKKKEKREKKRRKTDTSE
jgi:outer membrane biosynthesis protein TonB